MADEKTNARKASLGKRGGPLLREDPIRTGVDLGCHAKREGAGVRTIREPHRAGHKERRYATRQDLRGGKNGSRPVLECLDERASSLYGEIARPPWGSEIKAQ